MRNVATVTASLVKNSQRLDAVMAGLETLTGSGDKKGDLGEAAASIRKLADNLDKRTDEISTGLVHFSNSGLKEYEAFAVEGRCTLVELHKAIKNINDHPSQLFSGGKGRAALVTHPKYQNKLDWVPAFAGTSGANPYPLIPV
jgi:phospholipid/cholesterol/gamma-HCH transport system substrate-binding protein